MISCSSINNRRTITVWMMCEVNIGSSEPPASCLWRGDKPTLHYPYQSFRYFFVTTVMFNKEKLPTVRITLTFWQTLSSSHDIPPLSLSSAWKPLCNVDVTFGYVRSQNRHKTNYFSKLNRYITTTHVVKFKIFFRKEKKCNVPLPLASGGFDREHAPSTSSSIIAVLDLNKVFNTLQCVIHFFKRDILQLPVWGFEKAGFVDSY